MIEKNTIDPRASNPIPANLSHQCHPSCIACGQRQQGGLGLSFRDTGDGKVRCTFDCQSVYQGYPDRLHGGVVAMLLDAAMTHCLFARGITAVTAKLEIRFRHAVELGQPAEVVAWLATESMSFYEVQAELRQRDTLCTTAKALFALAPDMPAPSEIHHAPPG